MGVRRVFVFISLVLLFSSITFAVGYAFIFSGFLKGIFILCGGTALFAGFVWIAHFLWGCDGKAIFCVLRQCARWHYRLQCDF